MLCLEIWFVIFVKTDDLRANKIVQIHLVFSVNCWLLVWEGSVLLVSKFLQVSTKGVPYQRSIYAMLWNWLRRVVSFPCGFVERVSRLNKTLR
jgi:hypothetical protein